MGSSLSSSLPYDRKGDLLAQGQSQAEATCKKPKFCGLTVSLPSQMYVQVVTPENPQM